jgi:hypothetical protein
MAVTNQTSAQLVDGYRGDPRDNHGKLRFAYFKATQSGVGDATSTMDLCKLPPGNVRVLPGLSRVSCSALGAARTLDLGHRAYETKADGTLESEDLDAFAADIDVSGAVAGAAWNTTIKFDVYSRNEVTLTAQVNDGTIPDAAVIEGYVAYLYE